MSSLNILKIYVTKHLYFRILQGKFIRIHFGTTGKLASADIETCKFGHINIVHVHYMCTYNWQYLFLWIIHFRFAGKVESDIPAVWGEELPHLLSDNDGPQTRAYRYHQWLISSWPEVEDDELFSSCYIHMQLNSLCDYAANLKLVPFVIFLF